MTELSLSKPKVGEEDTAAEPKVGTAFTEVETQFNTLFGKESAKVTSSSKYEAEKSVTKAEIEAGIELSATRPAQVTGKFENGIEIGAVKVVSGKAATAETFTYIVPPATKLKAKSEVATIIISVLLL